MCVCVRAGVAGWGGLPFRRRLQEYHPSPSLSPSPSLPPSLAGWLSLSLHYKNVSTCQRLQHTCAVCLQKWVSTSPCPLPWLWTLTPRPYRSVPSPPLSAAACFVRATHTGRSMWRQLRAPWSSSATARILVCRGLQASADLLPQIPKLTKKLAQAEASPVMYSATVEQLAEDKTVLTKALEACRRGLPASLSTDDILKKATVFIVSPVNTSGCVHGSKPIDTKSGCKAAAAALGVPFEDVMEVRSRLLNLRHYTQAGWAS